MSVRSAVEDAAALHSQTPTAPAHTMAVLVLEVSERLSHARLQELMASTLPQLAKFRSRLVGKPLGVGQPLWADIGGYDPVPVLTKVHLHRNPRGHRRAVDGRGEITTRTGAFDGQRADLPYQQPILARSTMASGPRPVRPQRDADVDRDPDAVDTPPQHLLFQAIAAG